MKKMVGILIIVILVGLGNLAAKEAAPNYKILGENSYQVENIAGMNKNFFLASNYDVGCVVSDPTGTRLNIRATPGGKIVGKLKNGAFVYVSGYASDDQDREWSLIKTTARGSVKGWVVSEFLDCE